MRVLAPFAFAALLTTAGCMAEETLRYDGVTGQAGNAIAANTVLQMVDPWPRGVEQTDLRVPADLPEPSEDSGGGASAPMTLE